MRVVVLACFFLSGASGLILEMLWTRMLTLVFGSTTLAVSTVLTAFMGGLGLGSYLAGKYADRLKNPVRAYALAEAGIGFYALLVPLVVMAYPGLNRGLWSAFGDRYALLSVLRFLASAALLIVPTTLMGATLPILARHFVAHPFELRRVGLRRRRRGEATRWINCSSWPRRVAMPPPSRRCLPTPWSRRPPVAWRWWLSR